MTTSGIVSTFSYVVKRLEHSSHWRLRRMELQSSAGLESITLVFSFPQNGHFIPLPPKLFIIPYPKLYYIEYPSFGQAHIV